MMGAGEMMEDAVGDAVWTGRRFFISFLQNLSYIPRADWTNLLTKVDSLAVADVFPTHVVLLL